MRRLLIGESNELCHRLLDELLAAGYDSVIGCEWVGDSFVVRIDRPGNCPTSYGPFLIRGVLETPEQEPGTGIE
jgi:hypothetical protein